MLHGMEDGVDNYLFLKQKTIEKYDCCNDDAGQIFAQRLQSVASFDGFLESSRSMEETFLPSFCTQ